MSKLIELIDRITEFGENPNVLIKNKEQRICQLLADLYSVYLSLDNPELDNKEYDDYEPKFDSNFIKENVVKKLSKIWVVPFRLGISQNHSRC